MHLSFKDRGPVRRLSVRISNPYAKLLDELLTAN
jgi:hypothetical protein